MFSRKSDPAWKLKCDEAVARLDREEDIVNIISAPYLKCPDACQNIQASQPLCFNPDTDYPSFGIPNNSPGTARLYCWVEIAKVAARKGGTAHFVGSNHGGVLAGAQSSHLEACLQAHLNIRWHDATEGARSRSEDMRILSKQLAFCCPRFVSAGAGAVLAILCVCLAFAKPCIEIWMEPARNMSVRVHRRHTGDVLNLEGLGFHTTSKWTMSQLRDIVYSVTDVPPKDQLLQCYGSNRENILVEQGPYWLGQACVSNEQGTLSFLELTMLEDATKFPRTIPALSLHQVPHSHFKLLPDRHKSSRSWSITRGQLHQLQLRSSYDLAGVLSPKFPWARDIPLTDLPRNASTFAFSYPLGVRLSALDHDADESPLSQFFRFGGYMVFDQDENIVHAAAIALCCGSVMRFGEAQRWTKESVSALEEQGRLHFVSLESFKREGATKFAWVGQGEELGKSQSKVTYGGFVYVFNDGVYRYFPLKADWLSYVQTSSSYVPFGEDVLIWWSYVASWFA